MASASDHEFQTEVTGTLARLETKMDIIVGADGTGGWKAETDSRLRSLEEARNRDHGRRQGRAGLLGGIIGAGITGLGKYLVSHFWLH